MDKAQALHQFWSSFGLEAIDELSAYDSGIGQPHGQKSHRKLMRLRHTSDMAARCFLLTAAISGFSSAIRSHRGCMLMKMTASAESISTLQRTS